MRLQKNQSTLRVLQVLNFTSFISLHFQFIKYILKKKVTTAVYCISNNAFTVSTDRSTFTFDILDINLKQEMFYSFFIFLNKKYVILLLLLLNLSPYCGICHNTDFLSAFVM